MSCHLILLFQGIFRYAFSNQMHQNSKHFFYWISSVLNPNFENLIKKKKNFFLTVLIMFDPPVS